MGLEHQVPEVSGREVELFVIQGIIRNVHLPVDAEQAAVPVDHRCRVVEQPGRPPLEEGNDEHDPKISGHLTQGLGRGAGDGLGQIEKPGVFGLTEVWRREELLQAHDLSALGRGGPYAVEGLHPVALRLLQAGHLDEPHGELASIALLWRPGHLRVASYTFRVTDCG